MQKNYIKPEMTEYSMEAVNILAGSVVINSGTRRFGVSSFGTDEDDWSGGERCNDSYNFWNDL